jgi:predicted Zn-dependent peptidase
VVLGNRAYDYSDKRRMALSLLLNYVGGPAANSKLNLLLREKHGLVYNVESGYTTYSDTGAVTVYYACAEANAEKSFNLITKELSQLKETLLSGAQLARAKKQFVRQFIIAQDNSEQLMQTMGKSLIAYNKFEGIKSTVKQIEDITAAEIRDVVNEIFCDGQMSRLIYRY